jgi:hypothetical protein
MKSLLRALWGVSRKERALWPDYVGQVTTFDEFEVSGLEIMRANENYHEATLDYMVGVSLYRQIRVDRNDHLCKLVSVDRYGTIRNRARGGRTEAIYQVAMLLRVGDFGVLSHVGLTPVLASDFDTWATSAGWVIGQHKDRG